MFLLPQLYTIKPVCVLTNKCLSGCGVVKGSLILCGIDMCRYRFALTLGHKRTVSPTFASVGEISAYVQKPPSIRTALKVEISFHRI